MKILIPIKRVNDYNVKVRPNQANTDVDLSNVKMAVNPFCEIALEEAKKNNSPLPITEVIDKYYAEVQNMGGNRWDTSSLIRRFRK